MKLSVFPKAKALPSSGEEKNKEAKFTAKPHYPEVKEFETEEKLVDLITNYCWSPFVFDGYRREDNFLSTDLLVFDIDQGMTLDDAFEVVQDLELTCLALPTTSHTEEHHKFRMLFPLAKTITNLDIYKATYAKYAEHFTTDPACTDGARMYFGSTDDDGFFCDYDLLEPLKRVPKKQQKREYDHHDKIEVGESIEEIVEHLYGEKRVKIPEGVAYFLENAPDNLEGEWYHRGNSFLFTCGLQGLDYEKITDVFYQLYPFEVTRQIKRSVDKIINEGYDAREEE